MTERFLSTPRPRRGHHFPAAGRAEHATVLLSADARQRGAGVNVERPQPKARTNDVDAGEEWRIISVRNLRLYSSSRGIRTQRDPHQSPQEWDGQAGKPAAGHLFALGAHGGMGPQPGGFNHFRDFATGVGVMPLGERAPWLCPVRLTRPRQPARGNGSRRRAGRSRRG